MADTENKLEALEQEAVAEANAQADAPKKNAVAAEPNHLKNDAEDLGAAVVKPTDSNPDATKKVKQVSGQAPQKSQGGADPMPKLAGHNTKLEFTADSKIVAAFVLNSSDKSSCPAIKASTCSSTSSFFIL